MQYFLDFLKIIRTNKNEKGLFRINKNIFLTYEKGCVKMEQSKRYSFPKKLALSALLVGGLCFAIIPVMGSFDFTGGAVKDAELIAEEILLSSAKAQEKQKQAQKWILLTEKFCALVGLKVPGFLGTLNKYSNATAQFDGKTVSSLSELTPTEIEIMKEAGQYDLHTYAGLRAYEKHLKEKYQLNDLEALTLIHQYMADEKVKEYYLNEAIVMPVARKIYGVPAPSPSGNDGSADTNDSNDSNDTNDSSDTNADSNVSDGGVEVGSRVAAQQQANTVSHIRGRSEIDGARAELVEKSNELEREQINHQQDRATAGVGSIRTTISFDPYHMNETEKKLWEEQNTPDVVDFTFDGKKHDKK